MQFKLSVAVFSASEKFKYIFFNAKPDALNPLLLVVILCVSCPTLAEIYWTPCSLPVVVISTIPPPLPLQPKALPAQFNLESGDYLVRIKSG